MTNPRTRLIEELRRLERGLEGTERSAISILADRCAPGGAPPLASLEDQRLLAGLRERDRERVREVMKALRRVEEGTWGICEACGGPVGEGRLDVLPTAARCARCALAAG